jgi:hypothetical protein
VLGTGRHGHHVSLFESVDLVMLVRALMMMMFISISISIVLLMVGLFLASRKREPNNPSTYIYIRHIYSD